MIRIIIYIVFLITLYVLQGTVFASFNMGGVVPNLVLILTTSLGLMRGKKTGLAIGFFAGLLMDIFSGSYIGFYALLLMYLGYYSGVFSKIFYAEDVKLPIIIILSADLIYGIVNYVFIYLLKGRTHFYKFFVHISLPECAYTALLAIFLYPLILVINRQLERKERKQVKEFV